VHRHLVNLAALLAERGSSPARMGDSSLAIMSDIAFRNIAPRGAVEAPAGLMTSGTLDSHSSRRSGEAFSRLSRALSNAADHVLRFVRFQLPRFFLADVCLVPHRQAE
jgi:hypothetical protein